LDPGYRRYVAVPDFQSFLLPLLKLASDGSEHSIAEAVEKMAQEFQLPDEDRAELLPSGKQPRITNRIGWALTYLRKAGLLSTVRRGSFQLTERGRQVLAEAPARIDLKFLQSRFSEIVEFRREEEDAPAEFSVNDGTWNSRLGVEERIRERFERLIPDAATRLSALGLFAFVIENADEERGDAWYVRETPTGLRLMTGGLLACEVARKKVKLSVVGPISDEARAALGSDNEDDAEFHVIPGGVILTFPAERAAEATIEIKDGLNNFVDLAMARVRRTSGLEDHAPEAVAYVGSVVGRELPQPEPTADDSDEDEDGAGANDAELAREPRIRGRMQMFERGERTIESLMSDIQREVIALPDLQRPFVWEDTKVRDLLDSLFLGFPVGTLVLWHIASEKEARNIGTEKQSRQATTLIIDGQQRLTSLAAVIRGVDVVGKDEKKRKITIAFRPRDGRFEVADAAIHSDPEFVPNVTELWTGARQNSQIRRELINKLRDKGRVVNEAYEDAVERNLEIARAITSYRFPTIEIRESANTGSSEEDVAEIFVRLNNQGKRLGQADFVLTLLSVFHGPLRDQIEARAREMSKDGLIGIDTQQLLRAACGVAFDRARMAAVYRYLRGVDPITGEADPAGRRDRLNRLDEAAKSCMDPVPWRDFLLCVRHAGFINPSLISSKNAIVNAYALYIRGLRVGVPKPKLDELITRWVFVTLLTGRYSVSSETMFEQDLARVSELGAEDFVRVLDDAIGQTVSGDYWTHSLVSSLTTQKLKTSAALAFRASQVVLGSRALFSDAMLREVMDPAAGTSGVTHLFAPTWLNSHGVGERRRQNQVANFADIGTLEIRPSIGQGPLKYVSKVRAQLHIDDNKWGRMCAEHALPINWESMAYDDFLVARRGRMADMIRAAFRKLGGEADGPSLTPPWFLPGAEEVWRNIAETERALRGVVRDVYVARFPNAAATKIEEALPELERAGLTRALRARPAGADPLSVVDYLYLGQLSALLFPNDIWQAARMRLGGAQDGKKQLQDALKDISPVRNEIAHVREVERDRLLRANLACKDVLAMIRAGAPR
jgi:hypothetical protein